MITVTFPVSKDQIGPECQKIRAEIQGRQAELKVLWTMLKAVQEGCDHKGQVTGHNERDGSWGSPCPTCGYSY